MAVIPVITLPLAWTNEYHGLIWARYIPYLQYGLAFSEKTYGPGFWIYWGYSYLLLLAATIFTLRSILESAHLFRWQSLLVGIGILAPWAANLLYVLHINPVRNLDLTPLAFGITGIALAIGMFRWHLFDIKPVAHVAVISGMVDGLIILDNQGRILEVNPAVQTILGLGSHELIGKPIEGILVNRLPPEERPLWLKEKRAEIHLVNGSENRDYELDDSPFYEKAGSIGGRIIFIHDVTERNRLEVRLREAVRKQAEDLKHENEQRLASIYDTVGDVLYYLTVEPDEQYRFNSVNPAFSKVTGFSPEQVIGRSIKEIFPQSSLSMVLGKYRQAIAEKAIVRWEETSDFPVGHLTGDVSIAPVFDQAGRCTHLVGSVHDVTESKRAEDALRESEDKFKHVFENSVSGKSITQISGEMEVNQAFCDMLGYSRPELINRKWQEITYPEDVALTQVMVDSLMTGEKEMVRFTKRYLHKNGSLVWADVGTALRRDPAGQPLYLVSSINDITERVLAEEKLRESQTRYQSIFEHSGTANTIFDMDCRVVLQNSQSQELTMPADALGKTALEVFGPEQGPIVDERMRRVLASGIPEVFETKFSMPAGEKWVRSSYQPLFDDKHLVVGIQVISQDISVQKQAEETLRDYNTRLATEVAARTRELTEAQEKLLRQEKLAVLGQLAGSVGHELRNQLGVINNAVYYLKMTQPEAGEKISKYHAVIEQEVHNAEKIITDLLDFARVKSVDQKLIAIPILVQSVLARFLVPEYITTVLDLPPDLPNIFVDQRQMEQVLGNLTTNACQAMAEGGKLTISAQPVALGDGQPAVSIRVIDTGSGITAENLKKLFEPLFTTKARGIGLGLAVSKKLAEANGGRIEVESEVGKGSTFTVYLPVKRLE